MRVIYALVLASLLVLGSGARATEGVPATRERRVSEVIRVARGTIGWREVGRNAGPLVDKILASVGLEGSRAPWCAAWVVYVGDEAFGKEKNPYPRSAWSPDFVKAPDWNRGRGTKPGPSDAFGIYFSNLGRVAHTGLVEKLEGKMVVTIEGNTNDDGSREGDGVYRKRRPLDTMLAKRWL